MYKVGPWGAVVFRLFSEVAAVAQFVFQRLAVFLFAALAAILVGYTSASVAGFAPWLSLDMRFGDYAVQDAGMVVQSAVAVFALMLCFFIPPATRVMALENSHRSFHMGMRDVTRAYRAAHKADREGVFSLSSEFDSIRERIAFLRDHPDLSELEPSVLEVASQMSHISRELAETYSDAKVARARDFLVQRQQEIELFNERLTEAKAIAAEMRNWHNRVEIEENIARAQLNRLWEELDGVLPDLDAPNPESARPTEAAIATDPDQNTIDLLARRAAE